MKGSKRRRLKPEHEEVASKWEILMFDLRRIVVAFPRMVFAVHVGSIVLSILLFALGLKIGTNLIPSWTFLSLLPVTFFSGILVTESFPSRLRWPLHFGTASTILLYLFSIVAFFVPLVPMALEFAGWGVAVYRLGRVCVGRDSIPALLPKE